MGTGVIMGLMGISIKGITGGDQSGASPFGSVRIGYPSIRHLESAKAFLS